MINMHIDTYYIDQFISVRSDKIIPNLTKNNYFFFYEEFV